MAVASASAHLSSILKVTMYDHDPDGTSATDVSWQDMRDHSHIMILAMASTLTGAGANAFTILSNPQSDGSGTDVEVKSHAVGSAPNAVGDYLMLEAEEREFTNRYVSASLTMANSADENVVVYIRKAKRAFSGNTADVVA